MDVAGSAGLSGGVGGFPDICIETCISSTVLPVCAAVCVLIQCCCIGNAFSMP